MTDLWGSMFVLLGGALLGFLIGIVVGWNLRGEPIINPTDPRTRPSDYPTENAGFGPDYPFQKKDTRRTK